MLILLLAAMCFMYGAWHVSRHHVVEGVALWVVGAATLGRFHWLAYVVSAALLVLTVWLRWRERAT